MITSGYFMVQGLTESTSKARKYFEVAGGIAEEVLYNMIQNLFVLTVLPTFIKDLF